MSTIMVNANFIEQIPARQRCEVVLHQNVYYLERKIFVKISFVYFFIATLPEGLKVEITMEHTKNCIMSTAKTSRSSKY